MIALLTIFNHPDNYHTAFAGVPVSDLVARMGYQDQEYRDDFAASYHLGKTANENVAEYRRRSPVWNVEKLKTPLLIHTNTNDEDVNVLEVEQLIRALKAEGLFPQLKSRATYVTLLLVALYGASDELHQFFVPGRSVDFFDWLADFLGGVLCVLVVSYLSRRSARKGAPQA